ncbi:GNAT family N-acetyltransferase [Longimicrobium sp.]|uniref:GNAT family N-acetyltransferase n=1 Tax=Longimicrobium sp. TaxID=2029185 RepID=UPI002C3BB71B|nr:GNAT family N-acetyltransferase [Longimicrobium sp.]HSU15339.1 GNAT family N-acetyltransferase [Longimicrobium sp.]
MQEGEITRTPRLLLRRFTPADAAEMHRIYSDPEVMRFMGPPPASVEEEAANLRAHARNYYERLGFGLWAVVEVETGEMIGRCGLLRSEIAGRMETEISYLLARRHWGRGLAAEAAAAVLAHGFAALALPRIVAVIDPRNTASRRVAERIGMTHEGDVPYKQFGIVHLYAKEAGKDRSSEEARGG